MSDAADCVDGDLRLVGGDSENEGALLVCFNKRWGTVNGDGGLMKTLKSPADNWGSIQKVKLRLSQFTKQQGRTVLMLISV